MIKVTNLHKSFGNNHVLTGIDEVIKDGEVVSIIGPSGSGKSTFLRCLNLLETPNEGVIEFDDDGNNTCDYLIINTENGNVIAHYRLEADGGKVGKYIWLLEQGHSSAGKNFGEFLAKKRTTRT